LGESDLAAFRPFFEQHGDPPVLLLQSLSEEEQITVLGAEGMDPAAAAKFLSEAAARDLEGFLKNPQNLLMLFRAVKTGSWPKTRKELFELATGLLLQEFDPDRARTGTSYSVAELRAAAGAVCAARLISDVEAISLTEQDGLNELPSYKSLTLAEPQRIRDALGRRIFVAGPEPETVDYAHRTIAEFLGASFLANRVRAGLPLGRILALIAIDARPASELRGLHAWLAAHLPELASILIEGDPYGVLTYGDVASLPPSVCSQLVDCLYRLSKEEPWFRSREPAFSIGALARTDMVAQFRKVLNDPNAGLGLRLIILEALAVGTAIPEMSSDLETILIRAASTFDERNHALKALLRMGQAGRAATLSAYRALAKSADELYPRMEIIKAYYGVAFGPSDIVSLVSDSLDASEKPYLAGFADWIPEADLPALLDMIDVPGADQHAQDDAIWRTRVGLDQPDQNARNKLEVGAFYSRILARAWGSPTEFDGSQILHWMRKRVAYRGVVQYWETSLAEPEQALRQAIVESPSRLQAVTDHFFSTLTPDEDAGSEFKKFLEVMFFQLSPGQLLPIVMRHLDAESQGTAKHTFLHELALACGLRADDGAEPAFERLYMPLKRFSNFRQIPRDQALSYLRGDDRFMRTQGPKITFDVLKRQRHSPNRSNRDRKKLAEMTSWRCSGGPSCRLGLRLSPKGIWRAISGRTFPLGWQAARCPAS
jgi:hypothetical protein